MKKDMMKYAQTRSQALAPPSGGLTSPILALLADADNNAARAIIAVMRRGWILLRIRIERARGRLRTVIPRIYTIPMYIIVPVLEYYTTS